MSASTYRPALSLVLAHEGGYVNHPKDPGGPTNKGVTQRVYDAYRKVHGLPVRSVKEITVLEIEEIYKKQYWNLTRGDDLLKGLDYAVFDFAVNSGNARAIRYLQRLVNVDDDGIIGDETLAAVYKKYEGKAELAIVSYCANRLAFMKSLKIFAEFGKGWTTRVMGLTTGVQEKDIGVIDAAVMMARREDLFSVPATIEVPAKAIAPEVDVDVYPMATQEEIDKIAKSNDYLAAIIATSKL